MVIYEEYEKDLILAYSDKGFYIEGGQPYGLYANAIDPADLQREYEETDIPIEDENTDAEYIEAAKIMLGEEDI